MNEEGMNGQHNRARPYAIIAMGLLCLSIFVFFLNFVQAFVRNDVRKKLMVGSGALSMVCASLIFTQYHDLMTILSSIFGVVVVLGIMAELIKSTMGFYKSTGILCLVLLAVNNIIYYTEWSLSFLPLLQKITFAIVLLWVLGLNRMATSLHRK